MQKYLFGILTVACGVWLFTVLFEQYEEEIDAGYSQEALLNPYLASQQFLEKNDVKVVAQTSALDFSLIPVGDTVLLSEVDGMLLTESQIDKALAWVRRGGALIVGVGKEVEGHDSFLNRFDIDPAEYEHGAFSDLVDAKKHDKKTGGKSNKENEKEKQKKKNELLEDALSDVLGALGKDIKRALYTIKLAGDRGELSVQVLDYIVLNHPYIDNVSKKVGKASQPYEVTAVARDKKGPRLLEFSYGKGTFTALSSTNLWKNSRVGKADHAFFLAYLVPEKTTLHLFYDVTAPSIWALLKRYFSELLIASFGLLLLWLWRVGLRVEGIKVTTDGQRRVFTEHLTASAEFLASKKQYQSLLTPIKEDITTQMQRLHPGFTQLDISAQIALIAQRAEVSEETAQAWVDHTNNVNNQDALIDALKLGNAIRRKL